MQPVRGILAAIAIPRFSNSTAAANTAKAAADLRTIDSAISMYLANDTTGTTITIQDLVDDGYLAAVPKSPSGKVYVSGTLSTSSLTAGDYSISGTDTKMRGSLTVGTTAHYAEDFHK